MQKKNNDTDFLKVWMRCSVLVFPPTATMNRNSTTNQEVPRAGINRFPRREEGCPHRRTCGTEA